MNYLCNYTFSIVYEARINGNTKSDGTPQRIGENRGR